MTLYREISPGVFASWGGEAFPQPQTRWGPPEVTEEDGVDQQTGDTVKVPVLKAYPEIYEDDIQHPLSIEDTWSDEALAAISLYRPRPAPDVPLHCRLVSLAVRRVDGVVQFVQTIEEIPLADRKVQMQMALAALRWQAETGGLTFGAMRVPTDRDTQSRIDQVVKAYEDGDITDAVSFKMPFGFIQLGQSELRAIKKAGALHIQACFRREEEFSDSIEVAANHDALDVIDFTSGWPGAEE